MATALSILGVTALLYGGLVCALYVFQRNILYAPGNGVPELSDSLVPQASEVTVKTADGLTLKGWGYKAISRVETILYFQGNGQHIGNRDKKMAGLIANGFGVIMAGYRGYGGNPGAPTEEGLYQDGEAWLTFAGDFAGGSDKVVLYGESLGSGVSSYLASRHAMRAVVLEAPYTSITEIASEQYWYVPVKSLLKDRFESLSRIADLKAPLLILHGSEDRLIPASHGKRLFEAAKQPKAYVELEGGGHSNLFDFGAVDALVTYLDELPTK